MKKVLVVEDEPTSRKLVVSIVEGMGHVAFQCSSGTRALSALADNRDIALLITDFMMPDLDGKTLVRTVRADPSMSNLPIIMVSGVVKLDEISTVLDLGVSRFLPKPVKADELRGYIDSLLKG